MVIDVIYGNDQEAKQAIHVYSEQAIHVYSEALKITQFDVVIKILDTKINILNWYSTYEES